MDRVFLKMSLGDQVLIFKTYIVDRIPTDKLVRQHCTILREKLSAKDFLTIHVAQYSSIIFNMYERMVWK